MKLCDLETAKALQELGYDGEYQYCHVCTQRDGYQLMTASDCEKYAKEIVTLCAAPRLDDAAYWMREKHLIDVLIHRTIVAKGKLRFEWMFSIENYADMDFSNSDVIYPDYETALEIGVKTAIEIIKTNTL